MENEQDVHLYPPKVRNFAWFLVALFASIFLIWNVNKALKEDLLYAPIILIILSVGMIVWMMSRFKWMTTEQPYLTLTDEAIIIRRFLRRPFILKWKNIQSYQLRDMFINRLIEITVHVENAPGYLTSRKQPLPTETYTFSWGQIKPEDRRNLAQELDKRAFAYTNLFQILYREQHSSNTGTIFNKRYWMVSYSISLAVSAFGLFIFSLDGWELPIFLMFSLYFILYPFAKAMLDTLFDFILNRKQDQVPPLLKSFLSEIRFLLHALAYGLSIFIAPISTIFLIVTVMRARKT